jgi:signal transduction histidine kinase
MRGAFMANMSHELRTPLNGIIGFSELLDDGPNGSLNAEQRSYVGHILTSGRHLLQLVNDLLDLSKLEAGRLTLSREWSSVESIIDAAMASLGPLAEEHGVTLTHRITGDLPALFVDPFRMRQIVVNLARSGLKRTPEGGRVTLHAATVGQTVCLNVEDNGPTISDDELRAIFLSFEDLDDAEMHNDGADLGLALAKRLVDMHGGTLEIASLHGGGATFEVVLPATNHVVDHVSISPVAPGSGDQVVLVVDDDPQARELIAGHLLALGVGVVFARSASTAVELAQTMKPNAITLDIEMPGTDGWATLQ